MYASISLRRLLLFVLWTFGPILVVVFLLPQRPAGLADAFGKVGTAISVYFLFLSLAFGATDERWALWRLVWKWLPFLNHYFFPDLNGVWKGQTRSNWPTISRMLDAATHDGGLDRDALAETPLKCDAITMTIKASLFSLRISARLDATGGTSHSLTGRLSEDKRSGQLELFYIYRQETPEALSTDENSHLGAARLSVDLDCGKLTGEYWTKRSWRSGLNTAGRIEVERDLL